MPSTLPKLGRTQKSLVILLLTVPELVALVPLAMHYFHPSRAARDPLPFRDSVFCSIVDPFPRARREKPTAFPQAG